MWDKLCGTKPTDVGQLLSHVRGWDVSRWDKERERERKAAWRARKKELEAHPETAPIAKDVADLEYPEPEPGPEEPGPPGQAVRAPRIKMTAEEVAAALPDPEQAVRDYWGYSSSETRSKAERDEAARRMLVKSRARRLEPEIGRSRMSRQSRLSLLAAASSRAAW
jgi:hypothetical protein